MVKKIEKRAAKKTTVKGKGKKAAPKAKAKKASAKKSPSQWVPSEGTLGAAVLLHLAKAKALSVDSARHRGLVWEACNPEFGQSPTRGNDAIAKLRREKLVLDATDDEVARAGGADYSPGGAKGLFFYLSPAGRKAAAQLNK